MKRINIISIYVIITIITVIIFTPDKIFAEVESVPKKDFVDYTDYYFFSQLYNANNIRQIGNVYNNIWESENYTFFPTKNTNESNKYQVVCLYDGTYITENNTLQSNCGEKWSVGKFEAISDQINKNGTKKNVCINDSILGQVSSVKYIREASNSNNKIITYYNHGAYAGKYKSNYETDIVYSFLQYNSNSSKWYMSMGIKPNYVGYNELYSTPAEYNGIKLTTPSHPAENKLTDDETKNTAFWQNYSCTDIEKNKSYTILTQGNGEPVTRCCWDYATNSCIYRPVAVYNLSNGNISYNGNTSNDGKELTCESSGVTKNMDSIIYSSDSIQPVNKTSNTIDNSKYFITKTDLKEKKPGQLTIIRTVDNIQSRQYELNSKKNKSIILPALYKHSHHETCNNNQTVKDLTCSSPQTIFEIGNKNDDCNQYFTSITGDSAVLSFYQKGILKISLNNTYIKSGESFNFGITYEDTLSWNKESGNIDNDIRNQIKTFVSHSELFNKLQSEIKLIANGEKNIKGEWIFYTSNDNGYTWDLVTPNLNGKKIGQQVAEKLIGNNNSGNIKIKAEFQLLDAWTNVNEVNSKGVKHKYTNEYQENYKNDGKVYYTDLDLKDGYYDIIASIQGLSALNYDNGNNYPFWKATYKCGLQCHQEFYGGNNPYNPLNKKGYKFTYREINNYEPFPIKSNTTAINLKEKRIGLDSNWITWASAIGGEKGISTEDALVEVIGSRLANAYNEEPEYVVKINNNGIKTIRNYNSVTDNNYYSGVKFQHNDTISAFLEKYKNNNDTISGINVNRKDMFLNKVGYCGDTRLSFKNSSDANPIKTMGPAVTDTDCFCLFVDTEGNCVYNKKLKGVGN